MSYRLSLNTCTSVNTEIGRGYTGISVKTSKSSSSWSLFVRDQKPVALLLQKKRFPLMPANSAKKSNSCVVVRIISNRIQLKRLTIFFLFCDFMYVIIFLLCSSLKKTKRQKTTSLISEKNQSTGEGRSKLSSNTIDKMFTYFFHRIFFMYKLGT